MTNEQMNMVDDLMHSPGLASGSTKFLESLNPDAELTDDQVSRLDAIYTKRFGAVEPVAHEEETQTLFTEAEEPSEPVEENNEEEVIDDEG